jgi:hypothetical protein
MSLNIYVGREMLPWQTPTEVTKSVLSNCRGDDCLAQDLSALDLLETWVLDTSVAKLNGKEARNPYLVHRQADDIAGIRATFRKLRYQVRQGDTSKRQVQPG